MPLDEISQALLSQIQEIEQKDEEQVLKELAGESLHEFVYQVNNLEWVTDPESGRKHKEKVKKTKLSWVGTREVARSQGNIMASDPVVTDLPDGSLRIVIKFTDIRRNFSVFGGCHQPKKMMVNDYDEVTGEKTGSHLEDDPHQFPKGLSKAQRNSLTACISAGFATKMIERFLGAKALPPGRKSAAGHSVKPSKSDIKPKADWDKITPDKVNDLSKILQVMWDLTKIQPDDVWKELKDKFGFGFESKSDLTKTEEAWFFLKDKYCPK